MSTLTLVRHGQAQTHARDELSYDSLSPLGQQQAAWLGDHFRANSEPFSRVYSGTLIRHVETATHMGADGYAPIVQDARLNELEYFTMAQLYHDQHGVVIPQDREGFVTHLPSLFKIWADGGLEGAPETFQDFQNRINSVVTEIAAGQGPALVVTSGGLIGMLMRQVMDLDLNATARMCLAIQNTSLHRLFPIGGHLSPVLFNALPHLDHPDRHHARTHL